MSDSKKPEVQEPKAVVRTEYDRERFLQVIRQRREVAGGLQLKLAVGVEIPGWHLYWANDQNAEIQGLMEFGFIFVSPEEVGWQVSAVVADAELTDRISRHVGHQEDGSPMRAYLMKIPDELWQEYEAVRHEQADKWEENIRRAHVEGMEDKEKYVPQGLDIKLRQVGGQVTKKSQN